MTITQHYESAVPIDDLLLHPDNPRRGDEDAIDASMEVHGFFGAVLVQRSTRHVIAGNHRLKVARRRGEITVPVIWMDVDDDQARRLLLVDNRTNDLAGYVDHELARLLSELSESDAALHGTGFDNSDLVRLLDNLEAVAPLPDDEIDDLPDVPDDPITKPGEIWQVGDARLMCGDCRDEDQVALLLGDVSVNVAFTSPPYADRRPYDPTSGFVPIPPASYVEWFAPVAANVAAHLAADGSWFINIKPGVTPDGLDTELYVLDLVLAHVRRWGWHWATEFCWERIGVPKSVTRRFKNQFEPVYQFVLGEWKMRPDRVRHPSDKVPIAGGPGVGDTSWATAQGGNSQVMGRKRRKSGTATEMAAVQGTNSQPGAFTAEGFAYPGNRLPTFTATHEATGHHAAFPVGLPAWFTRAYTDDGDVVYDPFTGSGSTLIAAVELGRVGYGMELSAGYCDQTLARLERCTGLRRQQLT